MNMFFLHVCVILKILDGELNLCVFVLTFDVEDTKSIYELQQEIRTFV